MAVVEELLAKVREFLSTMPGIEEKPITGGIGFMWHGNLLGGVRAEDLLVRVAKDDHERFLGDDAQSRWSWLANQART